MDIKLEEGEVICDNCNGHTKSYSESITVCTKCWGTGKLDWVDLCVGKKIPYSVFYMPILRQTYPKLLSKEIISIQPINEVNR